ncbi:MAG: leucine-rich repeat protein [Clostridia bacterium]|nr:leucine-rich repeat protein [Clostridia bacterium]
MKKVATKIILAVLILAMAISVFVACETKDTYSVSFVSEEGNVTDAMTVAEAQEYFKSLPTREGYVFKGWYLDKDVWQQEIKSTEDIEKYIINGNVNVYARWLPIVDAITILFLDYNQASLLEYQCDRSDVDLSFLKPSAKPNDEKYTYTFDHWNCDLSDLTQAFYTATPVYNAELRVFEVKYYDQGNLIYTEKVKYGEDANSDRVKPETKPSTAQYDFKFAGWDGVATNVTSDVNLNAMYQKSLRRYKVTFNFGDNKTEVKQVSYGEAAIEPQNTQKSSTAQYKYNFVGWDNNFDNVQSDIVVNAKYSQEARVYEVSFWVDDKCIQSTNVPYGAKAVAPSNVVKEPNDGYIYTFSNWDTSFDSITGNTKVNAVFDRQSQFFNVVYRDWNGDILFTETVETGNASVYKDETSQRESDPQYNYEFTGWTNSEKLSDVRSNLEVYAQFKQTTRYYSVKFLYGDDKTYTFHVKYGEGAVAPTDTQKTNTAQHRYEFLGWDTSFDNIQKDTVVNAIYSKQIQVYTVRFLIDKGAENEKCIQSTKEPYGAKAIAPTEVVKKSDDGLVYTFREWNKSFDFITEDTDVEAVFDVATQEFEVKYVNWDGTILYTDTVNTGEASVYVGDAPQREANAKYEYVFKEWSSANDPETSSKADLSNITKSFAVYAHFTPQIRKYTVTFEYGDGKTKVIENVEYGSREVIGQEPTDTQKTSTAKNDFTFLGWKGYYGYVESDLTITAEYTETLRRYLVKFINDGVVVSEQEVAYGFCPTMPNIVAISNNVQYNYTVLGWGIVKNDDEQFKGENDEFQPIDVTAVEVHGEITYTAVYLRKIQQYTITFYNDKVLGIRVEVGKITVNYGDDASDLAPIVERDQTQSHVYTFSGWSKDLTFVSSDMEVDANYSWEWRKYWVVYYDVVVDDDGYAVVVDGVVQYNEYYREEVEYNSGVQNEPEKPTRRSTVGFDYSFVRWANGTDEGKYSDPSHVLGDTEVFASYEEYRRKYRVTFFDLSVYELISTAELYYEEKISTTIERDGYDFDAWYRDPDCNTMFNMDTDFVDGIMMLFGNTVIKGIQRSGNTITGYNGTLTNVILPRVIQGTKMTKIKERAFEDNAIMESVYIPDCYSTIGRYAFSGLGKKDDEFDIYTQVKGLGTLNYPAGWDPAWNWNYLTMSSNYRLVTNNVENVVTSGDYRYMLISSDKNTAIIDKFINNNASRAYIEETLEYRKPSFVYTDHVDEKTGQTRKIYEITYETKNYNITTISQSAFTGSENLGSVFIPKTITSVKKYAFSGISVNIYIQHESRPSGWSLSWNSNRSGASGERNIYWGVVGMDQVGDFTYIFKGDGTAVVAEFNKGSLSLVGTITIPDTVWYTPNATEEAKEYTVTELGDSLFEASLVSLGKVSNIKLPANLEKIGKKAFYMNKTLTSIELPSTVTEIGDYAFTGTTGLQEIFIPEGISKIGAFCFVGSSATIYLACSKPLTAVNKPTRGLYWNAKVDMSTITDMDLSKIASLVFGGETLPTYWEVAGRHTDVASTAVTKSNFLYILRSNGTAYLAGYSSAGMAHVTSYTVPTTLEVGDKTYTVTMIAEGALIGNSALKTINVPSSVTIEDGALPDGLEPTFY